MLSQSVKQKKRKTIKILSLLGIIGAVIYFAVRFFLKSQIQHLPIADNSSVTIIGGADGPTYIYVASHGSNLTGIIIALIVLTVSIVALVIAHLKKSQGSAD